MNFHLKMVNTNTLKKKHVIIEIFYTCGAENGRALNPDKSKAFLFSKSQHAKGLSVISTINEAGSTVALSIKIKLLGMTLDGNLNFK